MDIVIVIESSSLLSSSDFQNLLTYTTKFFQAEVFSKNDVKFAVISFAKTSKVEISLTTPGTNLVNKIKAIQQTNEKNVEIHTALQKAESLLKQNGGQSRRRVIITVSKNPSTVQMALVRNTALQVQNNEIQIIPVIIGNAMAHEGLVLASRPKAINKINYKDTNDLKNSQTESLSSTILRGKTQGF